MPPCIFCSIADKKIPSEIIFEDELTLAFLDVHPRALGHTLVIPKRHAQTVLETDNESLQALALTIRSVADILHASLKPDGFTIGINHGREAGQAVDHLHAHIIPRYQNDGGGNIHSIINRPSTETVSEIGNRIRQKKV